MQSVDRREQLRTILDNLDALIAFADGEDDHVLAATLDAARVQIIERYSDPTF